MAALVKVDVSVVCCLAVLSVCGCCFGGGRWTEWEPERKRMKEQANECVVFQSRRAEHPKWSEQTEENQMREWKNSNADNVAGGWAGQHSPPLRITHTMAVTCRTLFFTGKEREFSFLSSLSLSGFWNRSVGRFCGRERESRYCSCWIVGSSSSGSNGTAVVVVGFDVRNEPKEERRKCAPAPLSVPAVFQQHSSLWIRSRNTGRERERERELPNRNEGKMRRGESETDSKTDSGGSFLLQAERNIVQRSRCGSGGKDSAGGFFFCFCCCCCCGGTTVVLYRYG